MVQKMSNTNILYIGNLESSFQEQLYKYFINNGFKVFHFYEKPPFTLYKKFKMLLKLLYLFFRSNLIFVEFLTDYAWLISNINRLFHKPILVRCHRAEVYEYWKKFPNRLKAAARGVDVIICVHDDIKERLLKIVKGINNKVYVVYNGIDTDFFVPLRNEIRYSKRDYLLIGSLGYLIPRKGFIELIEIVRDIVNEGIDLRLRIGGSGPLYEKLLKYVKENNLEEYVKLDGFIPQDKIVEWYNSLDLFVMNSYNESGPLVLLEAMSCGLPVISTNVGLAKKIVDKSWLYEPGDMKSLKELILKFNKLSLKDREMIGRRNREIVKKTFDYRKQFNKIKEIIHHIINK